MTRELHEFRDLITDGCLDVLQPDVALVGGITGLRRVAVMAQEHNLVFTPHTWTNGIGVGANAHLAAGLADSPFLAFPYDPPEWSAERRDFMMAEPLAIDTDGWVELGDAPGGLGFELDEARLAATRVQQKNTSPLVGEGGAQPKAGRMRGRTGSSARLTSRTRFRRWSAGATPHPPNRCAVGPLPLPLGARCSVRFRQNSRSWSGSLRAPQKRFDAHRAQLGPLVYAPPDRVADHKEAANDSKVVAREMSPSVGGEGYVLGGRYDRPPATRDRGAPAGDEIGAETTTGDRHARRHKHEPKDS